MDANKPAGPAQNPGVAAEPDYVSARLVVGFGILFLVIASIAAALMAALFWGYDRKAERRDVEVEKAAGLELREPVLPPAPRLQVYPARHWKDFQEAERARLDSYGWMDRSSGAVHVPIDRAMELIAERGVGPLPAAPMAVPAPAEVKK